MENKIIKLIKDDNIKGLNLLIDKYSKNIYFIVKSILKNYDSEEYINECMSDIFIDIYNNINLFNKEKLSFNQFIILRTKYKALEYKERIHVEKSIVTKDNSDIFTIEDVQLEELINNQDNKEVLDIIKSFKEPDKTYFYLQYFRGYDESLLSEVFNESISGVQNKLYRCRFKIKNILERGAKVSGK